MHCDLFTKNICESGTADLTDHHRVHSQLFSLSSWATTLAEPCRLSTCSCSLGVFKFALEKLFDRACTETFANRQFRCKWNQNRRSHFSISFSSTCCSVMMTIRNKEKLLLFSPFAITWMRPSRLSKLSKYFHKNNNSFQCERQKGSAYGSCPLQSIHLRTIYKEWRNAESTCISATLRLSEICPEK